MSRIGNQPITIPSGVSISIDHPKITVSIEKDFIFGVQFLPEKSMMAGLEIIKNFTNIKC